MIGYNNSSMQGFGADDKYYSNAARFGAVQFAVGIPIFMETQKAKINSAKFNRKLPKVIMLRGFKICKLKANLPCDSTTSMLKA